MAPRLSSAWRYFALNRLLPLIEWLPGYGADHLKADLSAGLAVALVLIPQSMAYAQLAGPVAVVSLMAAVALQPLATAGSQAYIGFAVLLAMLVGLVQFALGLLRLGLMVNFLSHPVINGFTNAAAIIIATGQLSKLFGVTVDSSDRHYQTVVQVIKAALHYTHWPTLMMGSLAFIVMIVLKRITLRIPNVLVAVAATTLISWATGFDQRTTLPLDAVADAGVRGSIVHFNAAVTQLEQMEDRRSQINTILKQAKIDGHRMIAIDSQRDLDTLAYQMTLKAGEAAGYRHRIRHLLLEAGRNGDGDIRFYEKGHFPAGTEKLSRIWRLKVENSRLDTSALSFYGGGDVVDLSLGLDKAMHAAVTHGLKECRYIDVVRFDGPLFFANASYLEGQIRHRRKIKKKLKHIIIAAESINDMDASGQESLSLTVGRVRSAGIDISLSSVHEPVMQVLRRTHLLQKIGDDHIYPTLKQAIRAIHEQTHKGGREKACPLTSVSTIVADSKSKGA